MGKSFDDCFFGENTTTLDYYKKKIELLEVEIALFHAEVEGYVKMVQKLKKSLAKEKKKHKELRDYHEKVKRAISCFPFDINEFIGE